MLKAIEVPLTDSRISPAMGLYLKRKGFRAVERDGALSVIGEEGGEVFELGYDLFCIITRKYYTEELLVCERAVGM